MITTEQQNLIEEANRLLETLPEPDASNADLRRYIFRLRVILQSVMGDESPSSVNVIEEETSPVYQSSLKWAEDHLRLQFQISESDPRYPIWKQNLARTFRYFYKMGQESAQEP